MLTALAEHGDVTIRRAYGNWFTSALKAWDPELNRLGIRPVQQSDPVRGKNATDLALVIDAVDLTTRPSRLAIPDAVAGKPTPASKRQATLPELLAGAIAKNGDKQGWARVSAVANHMRQRHGQSAKDHGKATWTKVFKPPGLPVP